MGKNTPSAMVATFERLADAEPQDPAAAAARSWGSGTAPTRSAGRPRAQPRKRPMARPDSRGPRAVPMIQPGAMRFSEAVICWTRACRSTHRASPSAFTIVGGARHEERRQQPRSSRPPARARSAQAITSRRQRGARTAIEAAAAKQVIGWRSARWSAVAGQTGWPALLAVGRAPRRGSATTALCTSASGAGVLGPATLRDGARRWAGSPRGCGRAGAGQHDDAVGEPARPPRRLWVT